jgi:signal transduction histidine kinase
MAALDVAGWLPTIPTLALPVAAGILAFDRIRRKHLTGRRRLLAFAAVGVPGAAYAAASSPAWLTLVIFTAAGLAGSFAWRVGVGKAVRWADGFLTAIGAELLVLAASSSTSNALFVGLAAAGHALAISYVATGYRAAIGTWSAAAVALCAVGVTWSGVSLLSSAEVAVPGGLLLASTGAGHVLLLVATADLAHAAGARQTREASPAEIRKERLVHAGVLAAGMSHDMKNVLARMELTAEAGVAASGSAGKDGALRAVAADCHGVAGSLSSLFAGLAASEDGPAYVAELPADLMPVVSVLQAHCRRSGVRVLWGAFDPCRVTVDSRDLAHVITTLVLNAQEAVSDQANGEKSVTLTGVARQGLYFLDVFDSGTGIPSENVEQAFFPGFSTRNGSGMGLYIARVLAERNAGSLEYLAIEDQWAFRLTLREVPE